MRHVAGNLYYLAGSDDERLVGKAKFQLPLMTQLICSFGCECVGTTPPFFKMKCAIVTPSPVMNRRLMWLVISSGVTEFQLCSVGGICA